MSLGYNLGWEASSASEGGNTMTSLVLSYTAGEQLGLFVEAYENSNMTGFAPYLDYGLNWLLNDDMQMDISSGISIETGT